MRKHLRRLQRVWIDCPIYFVTTCTFKRRPILVSKEVATIMIQELQTAHDRHAWAIGRYVIMPDHLHFFCSPELDAKTLPTFMQAWKQWTSKRMTRELMLSGNSLAGRILRSRFAIERKLQQKWDYIRENLVRAGLVKASEEWPWQGEIESLML